MDGVPRMMAIASNRTYHARDSDVLYHMRGLIEHTPTYIREEVMCVRIYLEQQYDLAFNALVESFERAVGGIGRQPSDTSPPPTDGTVPIVDLEWESLQVPVQYLFEPPCCEPNRWSSNIGELGVGVLQEFLSWHESTRLDFIRTTYSFLGNEQQCKICPFFYDKINVDDLKAKDFGWSSFTADYHFYQWNLVDPDVQARLRAVGWIFWENLDRLWAMNLVEDLVDGSYGPKGRVYPHLRVQGRPHLLEKLVKPEEWEPIVRYFGPAPSEKQLDDIKGLFKSMNNLNPGSIAAVVCALDCQAEENAPTEAPVSGE